MNFFHTKHRVEDQGVPPDSFLTEIIEWGKTADGAIFAPRPSPAGRPDSDVYVLLKPVLGPWENLLHRRAAMLELMRVHAGFESSWDWNEGVDTTNRTSMTHIEGQETGIFQVSFDSTYINNSAMKPFAVEHCIGTPGSFIAKMKADHKLAIEYYARLVRESYKWAGPLVRHEVDPWLTRSAVMEFKGFLA